MARITTQKLIKEIEDYSIGKLFSYDITNNQNIFTATKEFSK